MSCLKNINELVDFLEDRGEKLFSLNDMEISKIEKLNNKPLPIYYKDFLKKMGKSAGAFMKGSSVFYDEIFDLRESALELIEENNFKRLPENSFIFWMHQGYQMAFFLLEESNNPTVYYYSETEDLKDYREDGTLLEFFEAQLALSLPEFEL